MYFIENEVEVLLRCSVSTLSVVSVKYEPTKQNLISSLFLDIPSYGRRVPTALIISPTHSEHYNVEKCLI